MVSKRWLAGVLALAFVLLSSAVVAAQPSSAERRSPLVGEWRMVRLEVGPPGQLERIPYSGRVIFTRGGTMSVQAMNPDESAPDTPLTVDGYESYYGPYRADRKAGTLVVRVASAAVRDLIGQRFSRNFDVRGNTLVLTPTDPAEGFRVTYERVS